MDNMVYMGRVNNSDKIGYVLIFVLWTTWCTWCQQQHQYMACVDIYAVYNKLENMSTA